MSDSPFLPPSVRFSQAFESGNSSGGGITRRTFIKRTGGATVATMVAWNLTTYEAKAQNGGSQSSGSVLGSFGMLCLSPDFAATVARDDFGPYHIPQSSGPPLQLEITLEAATSKIKDYPGTKPYNSATVAVTSQALAKVGANLVGSCLYTADHSITCDKDSGLISATTQNQPWTKKTIYCTVGTSQVEIDVEAYQPEFDGNNTANLNIVTEFYLKDIRCPAHNYSVACSIHDFVQVYTYFSTMTK